MTMSPLTVICCYSTDGNLKWHRGDYGISCLTGTVTLTATATNTIIPLHRAPTASCLWLFLKLLRGCKCKWNYVATNTCCCCCRCWWWCCCWELWTKINDSVVAASISASAAIPQCEQVIQSEPPKSQTSSWPVVRLALLVAKAVG